MFYLFNLNTINDKYSLAGDDREVIIGGIKCPIKSSSATEIVCVTEARPEGTIETQVNSY